MSKVIFTADTLIAIIKKIFEDEDLDTVVESEREDWKGKTLSEILNVDYYAYKHKPAATNSLKDILVAQDLTLTGLSVLDVLKRSFCLVKLDSVQRLYSKDIDQIGVEGTLQYWLQTDKVKLLEALIEASNIALCGLKLPVVIDGESRRVTLFFNTPQVTIEGQTEIGESAIVSVKVTMAVMPNTSSYADYQVLFDVPKLDNPEETEFVELAVTSIQFGNSMTPKSIPLMRDTAKNNNLNLSNVTVFTLVFDGYIGNRVVDMFANDILSKAALKVEEGADNNKTYPMKLIRLGKEYLYSLRIKDAKIGVNNDTGNEQFTVALATGE